MADLLVGDLAVVLEDVVVHGAGRDGNLLCDGLDIRETHIPSVWSASRAGGGGASGGREDPNNGE